MDIVTSSLALSRYVSCFSLNSNFDAAAVESGALTVKRFKLIMLNTAPFSEGKLK